MRPTFFVRYIGSPPARPLSILTETFPSFTFAAIFFVMSTTMSSAGFHLGSITPYHALFSFAPTGKV